MATMTIQQAVALAPHVPEFHSNLGYILRERMISSPLMDGPAFAYYIEAAYRQMWHNWCEAK